MCSHKSSLLHNVANAILVPCGSTGLWILVFGTESHPTSWCNSKTHGANTLLPLWWHSTLWANLSTCRILSTLFVVATKLKATTREMKDQPQTKIFRPWAPIAARRLIFVAHEKKRITRDAGSLTHLRALTHPYWDSSRLGLESTLPRHYGEIWRLSSPISWANYEWIWHLSTHPRICRRNTKRAYQKCGGLESKGVFTLGTIDNHVEGIMGSISWGNPGDSNTIKNQLLLISRRSFLRKNGILSISQGRN